MTPLTPEQQSELLQLITAALTVPAAVADHQDVEADVEAELLRRRAHFVRLIAERLLDGREAALMIGVLSDLIADPIPYPTRTTGDQS